MGWSQPACSFIGSGPVIARYNGILREYPSFDVFFTIAKIRRNCLIRLESVQHIRQSSVRGCGHVAWAGAAIGVAVLNRRL
jgi:hypothetical protein